MEKRKHFWIEYTIILLLVLFSTVIRYLFWDYFELKGDFPWVMPVYSLAFLVVIWEFFRWLNSLLNKLMPFEKGIFRRIGVQLVFGAMFMLLVREVVFVISYPYIIENASNLFVTATYMTYVTLSFLINSIFFARYFFVQWKMGMVHAERLEKEKSQVQFDNLKNQLNPHFLFNSLTSLNSLIFENQPLASEFLQNLSKVYRYVLRHEGKNLVSLDVELAFISNFIFLLQTRFGNALEIETEIMPPALRMGIVPVSLQVLLENAVKHNSMDENNPLRINIRATQDTLEVSNTISEKRHITASNKKGLKNLTSLYGFMSERKVEIKNDPGRFVVILPLIPMS
jgi:hypothetical protein